MKRLDIKGKKIGFLTVLDYSHSHTQPSGQKRAMWKVKCHCGVEKFMSTSTLCHGNTISCGCQGKLNRIESRKKTYGYSNENYLFLQYKNRSLKKFGEFNLTKDDFKKLIYQECFYCKKAPSQRTMKRSSYGTLESNGIDRIDSKKGYTIDNCVTCCKTCNTMKLDYSLPLFLDQIEKIYKNAAEIRKIAENHIGQHQG